MNRILAAGAGLLLCSVVAVAQPTSVPGDSEIRRILTERIDEEHRSVGIVVGVVEPGGRRVVGYGRLATDDVRRPDGDTVFEIGSITKVFTSIILADMVERGEVALDDPVQRLLPADVRVPTRNGAAITLLHLATHSSGLPRLPENLDPADPANPYADYTVAQLYAFLSSHELGRDIGETVEYSNLGVGLLGHALATRADSDYETLVRDRVLRPLAMLDTSITLTPSGRDRLAAGHDRALDPVANWDNSHPRRRRRAPLHRQRPPDVHRSEPRRARVPAARRHRGDAPVAALVRPAEHGHRTRMAAPNAARAHDRLAQRGYRRVSLVSRLRQGVRHRRGGAVQRRQQPR